MSHCANPACPYLARHRVAAEYQAGVAACLDCGGPLSEGAPAAPVPAPAAPARPWRAAGVSGGALALALALEHVPIPGVDPEALGGAASARLSLAALGLTPWVSAAIGIELLALVVPGWRPLRHGGPAGRARLTRATAVLASLLALLQAWSMLRVLETPIGSWDLFEPPPLLSGYSRPVAALSLLGGTFFLVALARWVGRAGLGDGFALLLFGPSLLTALRGLPRWELGPFVGQALLGVLALVGAGWLLRRDPGSATRPIRFPASGVEPLGWATALMSLPAALGALVPGLPSLASALSGEGWLPALLSVQVAAALGAGFALLFNQPAGVAALWLRAAPDAPAAQLDQARALAVRAAWQSAMAMAGAATLAWLFRLELHLPIAPAEASAVLLLAALLLDLAAEWRFRTAQADAAPVWPEHRPYAIDAALAALERAGIPAHARAARVHTLLQFFGPHIPVTLLVPAARIEEARAVLAPLLDESAFARGVDAPRRSP